MMLSQLLRYHVMDAAGKRARVVDLSVDLATGDYPRVKSVFWHGSRHEMVALPWTAVETVAPEERVLKTASMEGGKPASQESLSRSVLLRRDILDALVLDLRDRRAMRATDLWLEGDERGLSLCAADASAWAVIRRFTDGRLGTRRPDDLHDWKYVEFLRGDPRAAHAGKDYHRRIGRLPAGEIARLSDALPYLHAAELITLLPDELAADTLESMAPERELQVLEELDEGHAVRLLTAMRPDLVADLLSLLGPPQAQAYLQQMPDAQRARVTALLRYPENTAGAIMTNELAVVRASLTIAEAREALRERLRNPDFVYFVYVVDDEEHRHLLGVLSLRTLLTAGDGERVGDVMNPYPLTVHPLDSATAAAQRVIDTSLAALPVVDHTGRLLGAVTADTALVRTVPEGWRAQAPRLFS